MGKRGKRKKKCSCDTSNESSFPCRQCRKKIERKKNREEYQKRRNKRVKKKMTELSEPQTPPPPKEEKPTYPVIGMTILSILPKEPQMFPKLKAWLERASLTDLVILVPFRASSRHARRHIERILSERGASWASSHLVFQWPHESIEAFVLRVATAYDVSHFFDVDRKVLESLAKSPNHLQRLHHYRPDLPDAWLKIEAWLSKTCPTYIPAIEKAAEAGVILSAGK